MAKKQLDYRDVIKRNVSYINQQLGYIEKEDFTGQASYRFIQERVPSEFKNDKFRLLPYSKVKNMSEEKLKQYAGFIERYKRYKSSNLANINTIVNKSFTTFIKNNPSFSEISLNDWKELFKNSDFQRLKKNFGSNEVLNIIAKVPIEKFEKFVDTLNVDTIQTITSLRREADRIKELL